MFTQLIELLQFVDDAVAKILRDHSKEVKCRPGCADCCHAVFDISFIEAAYLASFLRENEEIYQGQQDLAQKAALEFEQLLRTKADLSTARIRCPLLAENDLCLGHEFRPINCRTYGTPTVIDGKAHVCGLSSFTSSSNYPSIHLQPIQNSLAEYSGQLAGEDFANRRFPIAWVFLKRDFFLPPEKR